MTPTSAKDCKATCAIGLQQLRAGDPAGMGCWLHNHLFDHVLPFWERHAIDPDGGILTCINDDGSVNSTEKWMWGQWRAVWMFSRIYRSLDRSEKWLKYARDIAAFCIRHAWDPATHHWSLLVAADGTTLRGYESTHVDGFAVQGLMELALASGDDEYFRLARETADAALRELSRPRDSIPHFPYPIPPGAKPHGVPMSWSFVLAELGEALDERRYRQAAAGLSEEVFRDFYRPDRNVCLEYVRLEGGEFPAPEGTAVVPGHAIEDMWFQIHVAKILGTGRERMRLACEIAIHHLELGWDATKGGIVLAIDADGREPVGWKFAETKLWWPHTEALYAMLLGWALEREERFFGWYERLWKFCLDHYVDWKNGEWTQKLNKNLEPIQVNVAMPVKDPYHLTRSLMLQLELLRGFGPPGTGWDGERRPTVFEPQATVPRTIRQLARDAPFPHPD